MNAHESWHELESTQENTKNESRSGDYGTYKRVSYRKLDSPLSQNKRDLPENMCQMQNLVVKRIGTFPCIISLK